MARAEAGDTQSQFILGDMYLYGEGVPRNYTEAEKWYRVAAEQGLREAQSSLGYMYQSGVGVAQNYQEALRWHRLAAEQGLILATVDATVNEISQEWFSNPVRAKKLFRWKNSIHNRFDW